MKSHVVAVASALTVAFLALGPGTAEAQQRPASTKPTPTTAPKIKPDPRLPTAVVNSWALAPTGSNDASGAGDRPDLAYDVAPGGEIKDSVTLFNYSNVQLTFRLYATDAFNNVDGQFDLLTGDKEPKDAGSWVTLPQANITVPAATQASLPITLKVPGNASPGDHAGAILASSQAEGSGPDGKIVTLDRRTGSRLYIRVAGPLDPQLAVESIHGTYRPSLNPLRGRVDLEYTVRNRGNVRIAANQRPSLRGLLGLGRKNKALPATPELLPGNSVTQRATFRGIPALALLSVKIALDPVAAKDGTDLSAGRTVKTARLLAIPWTIVALILALGLGRLSYRAYRRRQAEEGREPVRGGQVSMP